MERLARALLAIDGRGYKAYREIERRCYSFPDFELVIDHVQGDPYAAPSRLRARVPLDVAALPASAVASAPRRRATRDFVARAFAAASRGERALEIDAGGQEVLERSACLLDEHAVEIRFRVELPAAGRRVLGRQAEEILCRRLPRVVAAAARADHLDLEALERHCAAVEDQVALRAALAERGLVAFVGDGAHLPRRSGVDDRPLEDAVPFSSPESLRTVLEAPNAGEVGGMGIRAGVTLVVGGGFHGKSTLLRALERGVYDHLPDDGRELVVSAAQAAKIRAEDGRSVVGVDISAFIDHLPLAVPTRSFSTELASGSTSQAAALVEAIEAGADLVLVDEDTSATNFMIRDERMQALVAKAEEPITPFVDRVRELYERLGVSTILVMGGSGDYFEAADTAIQMDAYAARDVTARAHEIAATHVTGRRAEREVELEAPKRRRLEPHSIKPERRPGRIKVQARRCDALVLGRSEVDTRALEQLVDPSQLRAVGWLLARLARAEGRLDPVAALGELIERIAASDWDWLSGHPDGDLALPRRNEALACLSRLRGVQLG